MKENLNVTFVSQLCVDIKWQDPSFCPEHWGGSDYVFSSKSATCAEKELLNWNAVLLGHGIRTVTF